MLSDLAILSFASKGKHCCNVAQFSTIFAGNIVQCVWKFIVINRRTSTDHLRESSTSNEV